MKTESKITSQLTAIHWRNRRNLKSDILYTRQKNRSKKAECRLLQQITLTPLREYPVNRIVGHVSEGHHVRQVVRCCGHTSGDEVVNPLKRISEHFITLFATSEWEKGITEMTWTSPSQPKTEGIEVAEIAWRQQCWRKTIYQSQMIGLKKVQYARKQSNETNDLEHCVEIGG